MIKAIVKGILNLIISLCSLLLAPIDSVIAQLLPDLSGALTAVGSLFNYAANGIGWAVSLSGLSQNTLSLIVLYYTFKLTAPMAFYMVKLALSWYNKLKL